MRVFPIDTDFSKISRFIPIDIMKNLNYMYYVRCILVNLRAE